MGKNNKDWATRPGEPPYCKDSTHQRGPNMTKLHLLPAPTAALAVRPHWISPAVVGMSSSPTAAVSNRRKRWSPTSAPRAARPSPCRWIWRKPPASRPSPTASAARWPASGGGPLDHLINNAGHGEFAPLAETREAQFDGLFNVHVKGVFSSYKPCCRCWRTAGGSLTFRPG